MAEEHSGFQLRPGENITMPGVETVDGVDISVHAADPNAHHSPPSLDIFDKFREFISWVSLDGFTVGGDTGYTVEARSPCIVLRTNTNVDDDARVHNTIAYNFLLDAGKEITVEFIINNMEASSNQNIWLRMAGGTVDPPSETVDHFGWKIIGGDLWASNADGATQTITDTLVNIAATAQRTRLKIVFLPGTSCKFYVNDVLKATHTTNLPDTIYYYLHFQIRTLTTAFRAVFLERVLIEKEYA